MYISRSFKGVRMFFIIAFLIAAIFFGYVSITSFRTGQSMNGFELVFDLLLAVIFAFFLIFSRYDEIVFTDSEIRYLKRNKTIKAVKWDDYNNVNFKRGHQGNVVVILNNTSSGNSPEAGERNGDNEYHLFFRGGFWQQRKAKN